MRWRTAMLALALGMLGGAVLVTWNQREEIRTFVRAKVTRPPFGEIPLMVQQDQGVMRLRWSPKLASVRDAAHATLTITDGAHESKLELDGRELRGGLASYWPDGERVGFRLETDTGGNGFIEAPVEARLAKPDSRPAEETAAETATSPAPAKQRRKAVGSASRIDDGLEWTQHSGRPGHGTRSKHRAAF